MDVLPGDRLVVSVMSSCAGGAISSVIVVTPDAPIPTALGVLEVQASRRTPVAVWDNRGACTSDLASTAAPFSVTLDASVEPWRGPRRSGSTSLVLAVVGWVLLRRRGSRR